MGFCHRCGEITFGKCSKCGGRSVASTISSIVSEGGVSIIDRWQSQYADTILFLPEEIKSSPKRTPVTQSTFYNPPTTTIKKVCTCCSKTSTLFIEEKTLPYCKECHLKLFNKGQCPKCQKPVSSTSHDWIEYASSIWHAQCFTCFHCHMSLESNPLIDLKQRPCCESCFMNQSRTRKVALPQHAYSSSISSLPQHAYSSSSLTRPRMDRDLFQPALVTPPCTPSPPSSLSSRPCHACHLPLGDARQKKTKVPLQDGQYAWFHKSCFNCSQCHLPFHGDCATTDGHSFYHATCQVPNPCFACKKSITTDAFQFNNEKYHFDCFKCSSGKGCTISMGQPVFEVGKRPFCQACVSTTTTRPKLGGSKTCPQCQKSISIMEDTPGPLASRWHKKCLVCATCSKQLDSAAKMKPGNSLVYCQSCF